MGVDGAETPPTTVDQAAKLRSVHVALRVKQRRLLVAARQREAPRLDLPVLQLLAALLMAMQFVLQDCAARLLAGVEPAKGIARIRIVNIYMELAIQIRRQLVLQPSMIPGLCWERSLIQTTSTIALSLTL